MTPTREQFRDLARQHDLIPVSVALLSDLSTPVGAFLRVAPGADHAFLLESVEGGERWGTQSFVGLHAGRALRVRGGTAELRRQGRWESFPCNDAMEALRRLVSELRPAPLPAGQRFAGGAVGFLSYDAVRRFERLPETAADVQGVPDAWFFLPEDLLIFDNLAFRTRVVHWAHLPEGADVDAVYDAAVARVESLVTALRGPLPAAAARAERQPLELRSNKSRAEYEDMVRRGKEYIAAGDCIQVVLSRRLEAESDADPFDVYRGLRTLNPSPYMFYLRFPGIDVAGASPETLVRVVDGEVAVRPIAGTRRRGASPEEDAALAAEMLADPKERAEHVMLVDLGRNDVGRVAQVGSVKVDALMRVERYSHVMHLVSDVTGRLRPGLDALDALRAAFPTGTLSGAPKVRAMEIIEELEGERRGIYGGAAGYYGFEGNCDMAIAIRTMVRTGGRYLLQVGAGIVTDSVPAAEFDETANKGAAAAEALRMAHEGLDGPWS